MLRIRQEQMKVLSDYMLKRFEDRMVAHLRREFPVKCEAMGEEAVRDSIREGLCRAPRYGLEAEAHVARYVDLMYMLSHDFDTDAERPWAAAVLNDKSLGPRAKLQKLDERAQQELNGQDPD